MGLKVLSNGKSFYENFETHGILWKFWNSWYFTKNLKLIVFYIHFETHGILWRFLNPWYFTEVFKLIVLDGGFETHDILRRFLNPWYIMEILKSMIFNRVLKDFSWGLKKTTGNAFPKDSSTEETAILSKWLNRCFNSR